MINGDHEVSSAQKITSVAVAFLFLLLAAASMLFIARQFSGAFKELHEKKKRIDILEANFQSEITAVNTFHAVELPIDGQLSDYFSARVTQMVLNEQKEALRAALTRRELTTRVEANIEEIELSERIWKYRATMTVKGAPSTFFARIYEMPTRRFPIDNIVINTNTDEELGNSLELRIQLSRLGRTPLQEAARNGG